MPKEDRRAETDRGNRGTFDVPQGKRLVLALEDEAKIDQLHACGGNARCTTCRVEFTAGEPDRMNEAKKQVLAARGLTGVRLSCQIVCDHDMSVRRQSRPGRQRPEGCGDAPRGRRSSRHRRRRSVTPTTGRPPASLRRRIQCQRRTVERVKSDASDP